MFLCACDGSKAVANFLCFSVLLILLLVFCLRRRKPDYLLEYPDEDASRENIIAYDEEGAGQIHHIRLD